MGKKFEREERIIERLQQENRILKSENRHLRKKLKELSKGYYKFMVAEDEFKQEEAVETAKKVAEKICYDCNIGDYKEIIIMNRRFRQCTHCGKRGKVTILP